ncbi:MAG: CDP-glycerol glycerophosphotransferase family protein [Lachnospiraceae bacterium]|nr:CDP-glycerol glycerophosphotransferase family protein [Lachnospiraceae bacterium]
MRALLKKISPKFLRSAYRAVRHAFITVEFAFFHDFKIWNNRVAICNVWGFGDNPKYIARELARRGEKLDIVFITDTSKPHGRYKNIRFVKTNTPAAIWNLATARVWIDCNRKEPYILKRPGQYYIQTWHGSLPLKKIENDCAELLGKKYMKNAKRDSRMADLFISNSEFCDRLYRRAFLYEGEIARLGSARLDGLILPDAKRIGRAKTRLLDRFAANDVKLAVVAPTFRDGEGAASPFEALDLERLADVLSRRFGGTFKIVVRSHPLDKTRPESLPDCAVWGGDSGDLYELLEIADVLVTDYSNTLFEYAYAGRPVFLFAQDVKEYAGSRGMYFDYEELPYPHAKNMDELADAVLGYDEKAYRARQKEFFDRIGFAEDGHAAARIADIIVEKCKEK